MNPIRTPRRRVLVALATLSLVAAACGDDGDDTSSATTPAPAATTAAPATTAEMSAEMSRRCRATRAT